MLSGYKALGMAKGCFFAFLVCLFVWMFVGWFCGRPYSQCELHMGCFEYIVMTFSTIRYFFKTCIAFFRWVSTNTYPTHVQDQTYRYKPQE